MSCSDCCNKKVVLLNDVTTTNIWLNGTGVPAAGLGSDGDYYLDDSTGDYYNKVTGAWVLQGNLEGPTGPAGAPGGGATEQGVFTENAVIGNIVSIVNLGGNAVNVSGVAGDYTYYAVGKLLMVTYDVEVTLDATIGSPQYTAISIDMVPTPGNLSTTINSAQLRGTGTMAGLETGSFTSTGNAHSPIVSSAGTTLTWDARGGTLLATTDLIVLRGQMSLILN